MRLFRKKTPETSKKTKSSEEVKPSQETLHRRIITAEGWHRKVLGKPSEVVPKKRPY